MSTNIHLHTSVFVNLTAPKLSFNSCFQSKLFYFQSLCYIKEQNRFSRFSNAALFIYSKVSRKIPISNRFVFLLVQMNCDCLFSWTVCVRAYIYLYPLSMISCKFGMLHTISIIYLDYGLFYVIVFVWKSLCFEHFSYNFQHQFCIFCIVLCSLLFS